MTFPRRVAIVGAGPAGLMAADVLANAGQSVTIYDRMPSVGRKFLLAGRGGLNLTHSEDLPRFLQRYGEAAPRLHAAIEAFPPAAVRAWCEALGQETFVGSSGRVFPKSFKTSPLLRAWLRKLDAAGVRVALRHHWTGWNANGALTFDTPAGSVAVEIDAVVLALGGASWPRLGADGGWTDTLAAAGVAVSPLRPANCGFVVPWSDHVRERFAGQPLKRIELSFKGRQVRGEAVITRDGIEGGAIYAMSAALRDAIDSDGEAMLHVALRPDLSVVDLQRLLEAPRGKQSLANVLRKAVKLSAAAVGILHESAIVHGKRLSDMTAAELAALINAVPLRLTAPAPLAHAISTAGGIQLGELDQNFMLKRRPGVFVAGEMLDWEAPTGGYLLQACFSTGAAAAHGVLAWVAEP